MKVVLVFQDTPIHIYQYKGEYVIPVHDVANATLLNYAGVLRVLRNNHELFEPLVFDVPVQKGSVRKCFNRDGVLSYLMKVNFNKISPIKAQRIIDFQHWIIENLVQSVKLYNNITQMVREGVQSHGTISNTGTV